MENKRKASVWIILTVVLLISTAILLFICIRQHGRLKEQQDADNQTVVSDVQTNTDSQDAAEPKPQTLEDRTGKVKTDVTAFLDAMYNVYYDNNFSRKEQVRELLTMVTDKGADNLVLVDSGEDGEFDRSSSPNYLSKINIQNLYVDFTDATTANVFVRAEQIIQLDNNPQSTSPMMMSLDVVYDSADDLWKIDNLQNYNVRW